MRALVFIFSFLFVVSAFGQNNPERFLTHKVKKKETLYGLARKYNVSIEQIKEFNPLIDKIGLKKRMQLKIPVYPIIEAPKAVPLKEGLEKYLVQPKETKWRLAYRYGITIQELEQLNPQIKDGLKIGQEIVIPKRTWGSTFSIFLPSHHGFTNMNSTVVYDLSFYHLLPTGFKNFSAGGPCVPQGKTKKIYGILLRFLLP